MGGAFSKTFSSAYFSLKSRGNAEKNNRFAIIIPNKIIPKSTRRHLFKRFFANRLKMWPDMAKDCIIVVSPRIGAAARETIASEIDAALKILQKKNGTTI